MSSSRVKPGDVLGDKYRVERVLGAGGMGIVVSARHIDLNTRVALKFMLKEAMSDPGHAERFLREARSAVQLKSGHTAKVLDVGKLPHGEPFMVMEYLDGHDLDAELKKRGPASAYTAVDYIVQASEAIAEAHGLGIVHRDIKLKNLFLTTTVDGRPLVKVLDFGLAKMQGGPNDVSLTAVNSVFGSPQYMSPEQMKSAKDVDHRTDIWSLGVCLFELVTGRVPFDAGGVAEICAMVLKDPVPLPSQFAPVPPELEAAIMRCLEKDQNRRFQSVAEMVQALQGFASDQGSARRIANVAQQSAAQKMDLPTIVNHDAPAIDGMGKTLNAWDSGPGSPRKTATLSQGTIYGIVAACVMMALVGLTLVALYLKRQPPPIEPVAAQQTVADPTPTPIASEVVPPPSAEPLPAPSDTVTQQPEPGAGSTIILPTPKSATTAAASAKPPRPKPAPASSAKKKPGGGADYM